MNLLYYFRHMESSEALKFDFESKTEGLESLIQSSTPIHITFNVENGVHSIHVGLHARNHNLVEIEESSEDMHKSIDLAIDTLKRVLAKEKDKQVKNFPRTDRFSQNFNKADKAAAEESEIEDDLLDIEVVEGLNQIAPI